MYTVAVPGPKWKSWFNPLDAVKKILFAIGMFVRWAIVMTATTIVCAGAVAARELTRSMTWDDLRWDNLKWDNLKWDNNLWSDPIILAIAISWVST